MAGVRDLVLLNKAAEGVVIDEFLYEVLSMRLFPSLERVLWDSGNGKNVAWKKCVFVSFLRDEDSLKLTTSSPSSVH